MRILVLGTGAREHAIITALLREGSHEVICAGGNGGIAADVETVQIDQLNANLVAELAADRAVDLVVIGPEAPLVAGVADAVRDAGIAVFGPSKLAARIEGSKSFAKQIMTDAQVPTGAVTQVADYDQLVAAVDGQGGPWVIKADGLAAGKGVLVTEDRDAAIEHAEKYLGEGPVLVEEFLAGPEVSLFFLSDGETVVPLTPAQDYKRLADGDAGPNTGGMGAYSPCGWIVERFGSETAFTDEVRRTVAEPTIRRLAEIGAPFVGLLYAGLIVTDAGIRVIEFNARFGDPETQVILPRLTSSLADALMASATGALAELPPLEFSDEAAVTVVIASEGYPEAPQTGRELTGLDDAAAVENVSLIHAATRVDNGRWIATGGRVLNVVATGPSIAEARDSAYEGIAKITLEGGQHRTDIAAGAAL
ncbi:phosphoribosylamine--glycine ligase [Agrococcus casei]|uniref:phosphoribosylamine--glycine ligase n=2 Tax=Agrococcus casei TaxID=343512 RepID=UPI003F8F7598